MTLIAGELDIKVPTLSLDDIRAFLSNTKLIHDYDSSFNREERIYFHRNKKEYPWQRRILEYQGSVFHDYRNTKPFDNIIDLIDFLPIEKHTRVVLMIYQHAQMDYDFDFHFDKDREYGFRICYGLKTDKVFVEFSKLKYEYQYVRDTLEKIQPYMVEEQIYSLTPMRSNTVFCFNGEAYPHRVPVINNCDSRLSIIVRGELDYVSFQKLKYIQQINT